MHEVLQRFHPAVAAWFAERFGEPTDAQARAWPMILDGRDTLIAAPTGTGKTLAAFLAAIDELVRGSNDAPLASETRVVYVSPLKALSNDIRLNLEQPLQGIERQLERLGLPPAGIRSFVRTGDTTAAARSSMTRNPPQILVTTPESLYILLTSDGGRRVLETTRSVIVDEIHAVAGSKRGSHLALSLERLAHLVGARGIELRRIGLSATQRPVERIATFLSGVGRPAPAIADIGHRRDIDLGLELPRSPLEAVMAAEVWQESYDRLTALIREHRTTLIFVNTRRLAERAARQLSERLGAEAVTAHHGSLSREQRFDAEQRLKSGRLRALVATASLELGIDIGEVELVCNIGSTRAISTLLQRVGRSGHSVDGQPKGRLFPTSRDELIECAALLDAIRRGELEQLEIPRCPLDILAQQIVAAVSGADWSEDELFELVRRATPFCDLTRASFDDLVSMLSEGFSTRRGRRGALLHHDAVNGRLRARRAARLTALTSGGAIPDTADYQVVLEPAGTLVGTVDEDFAVESLAGDVFQLGNTSWRILRVEQGRVRVEDARGEPPSIPFWFGEAPSRSPELSIAVSRLRGEVDRRLGDGGRAARSWLADEVGVGDVAALQIVDYLAAARAALGAMPGRETLVLERFFDEAGNQHVVLHSPFGSRMNRAWGLALRKRFCRSFNFELQAAATEDAIVLSLGPTHSFPAEQTFRFLHSSSVRDVLVQALLDAPMFGIRWRWNASRALALPRWRGGKRVPPRLQRMGAEDLIAVVFPDQLACLENIVGEREIPDHPLVAQTIRDCLEEAMDIDALEALLRSIEGGGIRLVNCDLSEPSPLAHEILSAKPYAFLDDAPLEERRTQAVYARRWLDPETAADLGRLDARAIERVIEEIRPEARNAEELHDILVTVGYLNEHEADSARLGGAQADVTAGSRWSAWIEELAGDGRVTRRHTADDRPELWVAAERLAQHRALDTVAREQPEIRIPARHAGRDWEPTDALVELLRGRLESSGPSTVEALAASAGWASSQVKVALAALESEGFVMQGRFTPGATETEWCERRVLARIHRYTIERLRREIEPVSGAAFMRFLFSWQSAQPGRRREGAESLAAVLEQLEGYEAPAAAWESEILAARIEKYEPAWLDALCLAGSVVWGRASRPSCGGGARPIRTTPIALLPRGSREVWAGADAGDVAAHEIASPARAVLQVLERSGASFFDEIMPAAGLLRTRVEDGLAELVARGLATADSFSGLRALLAPSSKRKPLAGSRRRSTAIFGMENAGRWSMLRAARAVEQPSSSERIERVARALLRRYGVVFRSVLERESLAMPWRELLPVLRRLEARGEIRGGRFVAGFSGEQFALTEAVGRLRAIRRSAEDGTTFSISAADPLNLAGIVTPGDRVPAVAGNRILYRDGVPIAIREAREERFLVELTPAEQWEARNALLQRRIPPQLRAYLGRPA